MRSITFKKNTVLYSIMIVLLFPELLYGQGSSVAKSIIGTFIRKETSSAVAPITRSMLGTIERTSLRGSEFLFLDRYGISSVTTESQNESGILAELKRMSNLSDKKLAEGYSKNLSALTKNTVENSIDKHKKEISKTCESFLKVGESYSRKVVKVNFPWYLVEKTYTNTKKIVKELWYGTLDKDKPLYMFEIVPNIKSLDEATSIVLVGGNNMWTFRGSHILSTISVTGPVNKIQKLLDSLNLIHVNIPVFKELVDSEQKALRYLALGVKVNGSGLPPEKNRLELKFEDPMDMNAFLKDKPKDCKLEEVQLCANSKGHFEATGKLCGLDIKVSTEGKASVSISNGNDKLNVEYDSESGFKSSIVRKHSSK